MTGVTLKGRTRRIPFCTNFHTYACTCWPTAMKPEPGHVGRGIFKKLGTPQCSGAAAATLPDILVKCLHPFRQSDPNRYVTHTNLCMKSATQLYHTATRCASGCVVECWICNLEVAGSNLGLGSFAPRSNQPSIPLGLVNEYQLRLGKQRHDSFWLRMNVWVCM